MPTSPSGQGTSFIGAGSRILYVSYSTGKDSNPGTQLRPLKTKKAALAHMRSGYPDQMLCKCGDIWPPSDSLVISKNGAGPGNIGRQCMGPMLFGFYGSGNRPLMEVDETISSLSGVLLYTHSVSCNNLAFIGWEFYAPTRDPTASTYAFTGASKPVTAINNSSGSGSSQPQPSWLLIEDCRASYCGFPFVLAGISSSRMCGTVAVRRCLLYSSYALGGGSNFGGHSSAIYMSYIDNPIVDECAVAYGGWNPTLTAPRTVRARGNTLTWPISDCAFNALPFGSGATVYFQSDYTGPYFVVIADSSAGTFQVSATVGGSPAIINDGTYTMMWADPALTIFNHSIYLDSTCTTNNPQITDNLWLYSTNVMVRSGGTIAGNYLAYHSSFGLYAGVQNNETGPGFIAPIVTSLNINGNVVQHPGNTISAGQFLNSEGGIGCDLENINGRGGTANVNENIFSMSTQATARADGIFHFCNVGQNDVVENTNVTRNIFYNWNDHNTNNDLGHRGVFNNNSNSGSGNIVAPNAIDLAGNNSGRYPSPLRDLISYDSDVLGGPSTIVDAINQIIGTSPGGGRALQTWPPNLTAKGLTNYIKAGFGNPF